MKAILMLAALAAASGPPSPAADLAAIEQALARFDQKAAVARVQPLVEANRQAGKPGPDPLLNGLFGRLALLEGSDRDALSFLAGADGPNVPEPQRRLARMALATVEERLGDDASALAALAAVDRAGLTAEEAAGLRLQEARLRLPSDPAAALALARPLAERGSWRWEAELIAAQALSLLGDAAGAATAADRAWAAAGEAPAEAFAPVKAALVRAGLAAARGDRAAHVAMLNATGAAAFQIDAAATDAALPACGDAGLTPEDWAGFALFAGPDGHPLYLPVAASRLAAAKAFQDALAGRPLLSDVGGAPGGTTATVRCRTLPSTGYDSPSRTPSRWSAFVVEHGLYGDIGRSGSLDDINAVTGEIEALAARLGDDHPALLPLRGELASWLEARARTDGDVEAWQLAELHRKLDAGMARLGATPDIYETAADAAERKASLDAATPEEGFRRLRPLMMKRIQASPLDPAYSALGEWFKADADAPAETRALAMRGLLARFASFPGDKRRRSLLIRLGATLKESDPTEAKARWREAGLADDACLTREREPKVEEHGITEDDYPPDLVRFSLIGMTTVDAEIAADGHIARPRLTLSSPSGLFDEVIARKLPGFRITPAAEGGRPRACRGWVQTIQWRVADPEENGGGFGPPPTEQPDRGPST